MDQKQTILNKSMMVMKMSISYAKISSVPSDSDFVHYVCIQKLNSPTAPNNGQATIKNDSLKF